MAAKSGQPAMTTLKPTVPASVPVPAPAAGVEASDVTIGTVGKESALDTKPDARLNPQTGQTGNPAQAAQPAATEQKVQQAPQPLPTNHQAPPAKLKKKKKIKNEPKTESKTETKATASQQK